MKKTRLLEIIREEIQNILSEEDLNEMAFALKKGIDPNEEIEPRYKKEKFKKVVDTILSKVDGKKTMADVARELGVIQQKIRPVVSDLIAVGVLEKGEAESKAGKNTSNKSTKKASTGKRGRPAGKLSGMDSEDKEAVKDGEKDDIVKTVSSTPEEKKEKFNLGVKFIKKYKDDKPKVDAYLKKAKEEYKLPKSMLDDLKRTAGREVKV
jgi:hypothetical protein